MTALNKTRITLFVFLIGQLGCTKKPLIERAYEIEGFKERGALSVTSPTATGTQIPLVLVLHGYRANAFTQKAYFRFGSFQNDRLPFHLAYVDGSKDRSGDRFWNASPSCCNLHGSNVDDVAYLTRVIETLKEKLPVSKVYLIGHSNGGFMAYRMLCDRSELIDGIVSVAGMSSPLCSKKSFPHPVRILHIHGTKDDVISENGGSFKGQTPFPSLKKMTDDFGEKMQCDLSHPSEKKEDYSSGIPGKDSIVTDYACKNENRLSVIRILGASHVPFLNEALREEILRSLFH